MNTLNIPRIYRPFPEEQFIIDWSKSFLDAKIGEIIFENKCHESDRCLIPIPTIRRSDWFVSIDYEFDKFETIQTMEFIRILVVLEPKVIVRGWKRIN